MKIYSIILAVFLGFVSCSGSKKTTQVVKQNNNKHSVRSPKTIVYKTVRDYHMNVPVLMDKQKQNIISYPAPSDVFYKGKLAIPTLLKNNYWLDNRGINVNVVFTSYTYNEYAKLPKAPSLEILKAKIIDYNPLLEMHECGFRSDYNDEVKELNAIIDAGFPNCKRLFGFGNIQLNEEL